jgi:type IX secretion system PorP/SprF family membrane protein
MNIGLAYQWRDLTISFAIPHVANSNVTIANQMQNTEYNTERQYQGGVSYEFHTKNRKWGIEPSVLVKSAIMAKGSSDPVQVDVNVMANYRKIVFFGIGYRMDYGITGTAAVRISRVVTLGYAYDYPIVSHTNYGSLGGTHEVIVGLNMDRWLKNDALKKQQRRIDTLEMRMQDAPSCSK